MLASAGAARRRPARLEVIDLLPTCLSLPEGLLQPVRPHILAGLAHRQLLAAHPFPEVKFSFFPDIRQIKIAVAPAPCVMP